MYLAFQGHLLRRSVGAAVECYPEPPSGLRLTFLSPMPLPLIPDPCSPLMLTVTSCLGKMASPGSEFYPILGSSYLKTAQN